MDTHGHHATLQRVPRACAYCRMTGVRLTREHVLNDALARGRYLAVDRVRDTVGRRPFVTRDVCEQCNNVRLSWLDRYGAQLNTEYFSTPVDLPINITFTYAFKPLAGWLVKTAFNHARWQGLPAGGFRTFVPYLLGEVAEPPVAMAVFLGIVAPVPTQTPGEKTLGPMMYPTVFGVGPIRIPGVTDELLFSSLVMLQSYLFAVLAWPAGTPLAARRRTLDGVARESPQLPDWRVLRELRPTRTWVRIERACMDVRRWFHARAQWEVEHPPGRASRRV